MKITHVTLTLVLTSLVAVGFGCSKSDDGQSDAQKKVESGASAAQERADKAAAAVKDTAAKAADAAKEAAQKAAEAAKDAASKAADSSQTPADATKAAASDAAAKAQSILDAAKKLVAEGKLQDAAKSLESLTGLKLTPEQQTMLSSLKEQIAKLPADTQKLSEGAGKAVGDLLKK